MDFGLLERVGLALAIGLLIGVERGWQERELRDGARAAGIRTYALIGLLGGVCGLLSSMFGAAVLGFSFFAFALPFGFFEWREMQLASSVSATGLIAGLLAFILGAYAVSGDMAIAAAAAVGATVILAERQFLHGFLRRLKWRELRAALFLLVMSVVLLPILPNRAIDPWQALNPHQIWLLAILVAVISYGGYLAIKLVGPRNGLFLAGLLGGLVTSTTVTWTFARLAKERPGIKPDVIAGVLAAWIVSLLRMTALAVIVAPDLWPYLLTPVAVSCAALLLPCVVSYSRVGTASDGLMLRNPFELNVILSFTALLALIMLFAKWLATPGGSGGLAALGAISGLLDVGPITLSMAKMAGSEITAETATIVILIAAAANALTKSILALTFGGLRLGGVLAGSAAAAASLAALAMRFAV